MKLSISPLLFLLACNAGGGGNDDKGDSGATPVEDLCQYEVEFQAVGSTYCGCSVMSPTGDVPVSVDVWVQFPDGSWYPPDSTYWDGNYLGIEDDRCDHGVAIFTAPCE